MRFIKKITADCDNIDFEYAKKIEDGIEHFSMLCNDSDIKCEKTCPFYSLCGDNSNDIISKFVQYVEDNAE